MFNWLKYSKEKYVAYCLINFIFAIKSTWRFGGSAFTIKGFCDWKKVNDGTHYSIFIHMGNEPCSSHNTEWGFLVMVWGDLFWVFLRGCL
jgi:hypothetical protein